MTLFKSHHIALYYKLNDTNIIYLPIKILFYSFRKIRHSNIFTNSKTTPVQYGPNTTQWIFIEHFLNSINRPAGDIMNKPVQLVGCLIATSFVLCKTMVLFFLGTAVCGPRQLSNCTLENKFGDFYWLFCCEMEMNCTGI